LMFIPGTERIFATASDTVYLWDQSKRASDGYGRTVLSSPYERALTFADFEQSLEPLALPPVWDTGKYCAPIVGFDVAGGTRLVAAHCDGQCVLWDLQTLQAMPQRAPPALSHVVNFGREIADIVWAPTSVPGQQFAVCGAGGVHLYDAQSPGRPIMTIPESASLGRPCHKLVWNGLVDHQIAVAADTEVHVLDLRQVSRPLQLLGHKRRVRDLGWASHDSSWLCTCADDGNALMWTTDDSEGMNGGEERVVETPKTQFGRPGQVVRRLAWGRHDECRDWIAVTVDDKLEVVHV